MSSTSKSGDITFKSSAEIKSFVRHQMEKPGSTSTGAYIDRASSGLFFKKTYDGTFRNIAGQDVSQRWGPLEFAWLVVFRNFLNPVDQDGSYFKSVEENWHSNELGFIIGVGFSLAILW